MAPAKLNSNGKQDKHVNIQPCISLKSKNYVE